MQLLVYNSFRIAIDKPVQLFNKFLQKYSLVPDLRIEYSPGVDQEKANEILGFQNAALTWDETRIMSQEAQESQVQDLSELGVGLHFRPRHRR